MAQELQELREMEQYRAAGVIQRCYRTYRVRGSVHPRAPRVTVGRGLRSDLTITVLEHGAAYSVGGTGRSQMRRFMQMMTGLKLKPPTAKEAMDAIVQPATADVSARQEPKHLKRLAEYQRNLRALRGMLDEPVTRSRVSFEATPQVAAEVAAAQGASDAGDAAESFASYSASFASSRSLSGREEAAEAVEAEPRRETPGRYVPVEGRRTFADVESRRLPRPSDGSVSSSTITDVSPATEL